MTRLDYIYNNCLSFFESNAHMNKHEFLVVIKNSLELATIDNSFKPTEEDDIIKLKKENEMLKHNIKLLAKEI